MGWDDPHGRHPDPQPQEFGHWLTPEQCFSHLPDGAPDQELVNRLIRRLTDGKLIAAAAEARWREDGELKKRFIAITIDPAWWFNAQDVQADYSDIWRSGEFTCLIDDGSGIDHIQVNFYGVKFEDGEMYRVVPGLKERNPRIPKLGGGHLGPGDPLHDQMQLRMLKALDARGSMTAPEPVYEPRPRKLPDPITPLRGGRNPATSEPAETPRPVVADFDEEEFAELTRRMARRRGEGPYDSGGPVISRREAEDRAREVFDSTRSESTPLRRRGPKPKTFWGDAMSAVEARISSGTLRPSAQADVETAMLEWIVDNGYDAGESTIRNYARPVWERFQRGQ